MDTSTQEEKAPLGRFVFFGSGDLAHRVLRELVHRGYRPVAVVTTPDRPRGRGRKVRPGPVKVFAQAEDLPLLQPERLKDPAFLAELRALRPTYLVLTDYGKILPPAVLETPEKLALNLHPSQLPRYRGAAPIERALMAGEREIGLTILVMVPRVDAGPILLQETLAVPEGATRGDLLPEIARRGTDLLLRAVAAYERGEIRPVPQPEAGASYAPKIRPEETWLDLNRPAEELARQVQALSPRPGVRVRLDGKVARILRARAVPGLRLAPWQVHIQEQRLFLGTSEGALEILELVPEGKRPMSARDFLLGHRPRRASSPHGPTTP